MASREAPGTPPESVISIIGPGMKVVGDCQTDGTVRVEGTIEGSIEAGKAVVIGKQGSVVGNVTTQDAIVSGRVEGTLVAESRLELQATCHIEGEVRTRRMQLEEGAVLNGTVQMGETKVKGSGATAQPARTTPASASPPQQPTAAAQA